MADVSRAETIEMLERVPLFAGLSKRQKTTVAKLVDHVSFEPGAVVLKENEIGQRLVIIRSGTAGVTRRGAGSADAARRLATVGPGDVVGELSLIDGRARSASVVAETPLDTLVLYRTKFNKLLDSTPELYPHLLTGMAARVRASDRRADVTD